MRWLEPQATVSEAEHEAGLRRLVYEGALSSSAGALTSGVILTALALELGASNVLVGILASAPFLAQLLQAPAILLVERWRARKRIAVVTSLIGRSMLVLMGLAAFAPPPLSFAMLLLGQCVLCGLGAIGSCAWNAWLRDLAPEGRLGQVIARRTLYSGAVALVASLAAGFAVDRGAHGSLLRHLIFAGLYLFGCVTGLASAAVVARMPEPQMRAGQVSRANFIQLLREPLQDPNFRRLIRFLTSWQFAINLATSFFTVFLVRQLGFGLSFVMVLSVASQLTNLGTLRAWGAVSDRFSNKSALLVAAPTYILCILGMAGASQIGAQSARAVYLIGLHLLMGASVAGTTLASANIALKLSPKGSATAYVATNALVTSLAAGIAPILGGAFADFFGARKLEFLVRWTSPHGVTLLAPLRISHWDFYFVLAGAIGLYALHRLSFVQEAGEVKRREVLQQMFVQTRQGIRNLSPVAGLRALTEFPAGLIREAQVRARHSRRRDALDAAPPVGLEKS